MNAERSPGEIVKLVRRHGGLVIALGLTAMMLASGVSLFLTKTYAVETKLEVGAVNNLSGQDYLNRVNAASEQIKSHDAMAEVCKKLNLDAAFLGLPEAERNEKREMLLQSLRAQTNVDLIPQANAIYFVAIGHKSPDADLCVRVVSELADYYQRLAADLPTEQQQKSVDQFARAAADAKETYDRAAAELLEYSRDKAEFLEGASEKLATTQQEIKELEQVEIASLEKSKRDLESMLEKEPQFISQKGKTPDSIRMKGIEDKIREITETLTRMRVVEKKTDEHPEVIAQLELLEKVTAEKKKLMADAPETEQKAPNPQYNTLSAELRAVTTKLDTANRKRARLKEQEKDQKDLAKRTPDIVAKKNTLAAAADAAKKELDARKADEEKAQRLLDDLRNRGTLVIRQIDPPVKPRNPAGPGALVLALAGLIAGLGAGVGVAFGMDAMDRSFREVDVVAEFLGVPTMGAIHVIQTPAESAQRRQAKRRRVATLTGLAVVAGVVFAVALLGDAHAIREFVKSTLG